MPRKKVWPPRPHIHKASGQERICVDGEHIYLGKAGSDEARRNYADVLAKLINRKPTEKIAQRKGELTVAELVTRHSEEAVKRYDPAGREAAQFGYSCAPLLAKHCTTLVSRFGVQQLDEVRDEMIARQWRRGVINRRIIRIRTLFRWGEQKGLCPPGTWSALRSLSPLERSDQRIPATTSREPVAWADLAAVCRQCPTTARDLLLTLYFTGARPSELRSIRVGDIDQSEDIWVSRPVKHKMAHRGQSRAIFFGEKAQAVLRDRLKGLSSTDYVFSITPGKCYAELSFSRAVARACERAGVKITPYQMRHSAKQRMTRAMGLDAARAALGQTSIQTTDRYAAGADETLAREAARKAG